MDSEPYDAIVVGGGLAGCSMAIQLGRCGRRVLLLEKKSYPAAKLCGEFLSVEVQGMLSHLGVLEEVLEAGAVPIRRFLLSTMQGSQHTGQLPGVALGISRTLLDSILFEKARQEGVHAFDGTPVLSVSGSLETDFDVQSSRGSHRSRAVVGAYGKRSSLDRKLERPFLKAVEPFVAFKMHYRGFDTADVIELHAFQGGYCGLSRVEDGVVNACWIAHGDVLRNAGGSIEEMMVGALKKNPILRDRLRNMEPVWEKHLAISQISFARKGLFDTDVMMVGDAASMIAPLCGDGMAMALRAAELGAPLLDEFLAGSRKAMALKQAYARSWQAEFNTRLTIGRVAQWGFIRPALAEAAVRWMAVMPQVADWIVRHTRGKSTCGLSPAHL